MFVKYASMCCVTVAVVGQAIVGAPAATAAESQSPPQFGSASASSSAALKPLGNAKSPFNPWPVPSPVAVAPTPPPAPPRPAPVLVPVSPNPNASGRSQKKFATFQKGECSFPGVKNPSSCDKAQKWAIDQVKNPSQGWAYLCLSFVTHAYGRSSGAPTASAMWSGLSSKRKHPGDVDAPAGALMFWGPNHVAISLGNRMLISTDVLGSGRAFVVSYATMQSVWNLDYLGWAEPDFS